MEINSEIIKPPYPVSIIMNYLSDINSLSRLIESHREEIDDNDLSSNINNINIEGNQITLDTDQGSIYVSLIDTASNKVTYKLNINNMKNLNEIIILFNSDPIANTLWLTINIDIPYVMGLMLKPKIKEFMNEINTRLSQSIE
ncbi:MAG: hypothetical protein WBH58_01535 [Bacteroidales bacterium]|jgi:hypothetical protein|nr:hypothetical protein [Bacteroidales bacterium]MDI9575517.1 hypothetical protein [Bacteroidota bacterium]MDD3755991.1 hypothetical protein [Bacteroidales bacterium]MDY0401181.1 hypothetical protein [Bacteroidales bacterium]HHW59844.1 hypothetical protein [Bacteroidales bacterium]